MPFKDSRSRRMMKKRAPQRPYHESLQRICFTLALAESSKKKQDACTSKDFSEMCSDVLLILQFGRKLNRLWEYSHRTPHQGCYTAGMRLEPPPLKVGNHAKSFGAFSRSVAAVAGRPAAFLLACSIIVIWLITGPIFGFSDTWQLVINTGTTIVTFLMVFLIQNTQNRDTQAIQLKLDELIRSTKGAHNALLDLEELDEAALEQFRARYEALARDSRLGGAAGRSDTDTPDP